MSEIPTVDVGPLPGDDDAARATGAAIDAACRTHGFFSVVGHGIDPTLLPRLDALARDFFARPDEEKARVSMGRGGRAWRGWFPVGGELTSGVPDRKEGLYVGTELAADDPRVRAGLPLHGPNLFPDEPAALGPTVLEVLDALTRLGHRLLEGVALGLGLDRRWFAEHLTGDPTVLFRIFHYPPAPPAEAAAAERTWGVAEHTDYGLLTLLHQDATGGLEVRSADGRWVEVPPADGAFVCNLGDMLERMSAGRYRSTPHRVRSPGDGHRISCPFFFDPAWDAEVVPLPLASHEAAVASDRRWDGRSVFEWSGTYGEYLAAKVAKVFPELFADVVAGDGPAPPGEG